MCRIAACFQIGVDTFGRTFSGRKQRSRDSRILDTVLTLSRALLQDVGNAGGGVFLGEGLVEIGPALIGALIGLVLFGAWSFGSRAR
jgi:hypothetical protein